MNDVKAQADGLPVVLPAGGAAAECSAQETLNKSKDE